MYEWIMLGIGVLLTVGTGLFVASEFALVNLDRSDLEARESRGERHLGTTIRALKITSTHLSSAQLGITLTTLLTGYTLEPALSSFIRAPLLGLGMDARAVAPTAASWFRRILPSLSHARRASWSFRFRSDSPSCSGRSSLSSTAQPTASFA
jgi:CBS domain containing-hemolysin-like protein